MKVLLISANTLTSPYPVYPLGLDYVAAALAPRHQVQIADLNSCDLCCLDQVMSAFLPQIIGISLRNIDNTDGQDAISFVSGYQQLIRWLRARTSAVLVCGGSGFTIMPDELLRLLQADFGVVGEGERFALLADAVERGEDPRCIEGVLAAESPAVLPPPWNGLMRRQFRADAAHLPYYLEQGGMLNLQTKRGCIFRCSYCPYPHIEGNRHRYSDPRQVAAIACELQAAGARYLFFTDSAFNSDVEHSLQVAQALREAGLSIPWGAFFAPIPLPAEYFTEMAAAGCRHVEFGSEALSAAMLTAYRKPFQVRDVLAAHQQARQARLHVAHYLLLGGPGESAATVTSTLTQLEQLPRAVLFFFIGVRIYPHTRLYEVALAEEKIAPETSLLEPFFYQPDAISLLEIEQMITSQAAGRRHWVVGNGSAASQAVTSQLYRHGCSGPLWEYLLV